MDGAVDIPALQEKVIIGIIITPVSSTDLDRQALIQVGGDQGGQVMAIIPSTTRDLYTGNHLRLRVEAGVHLLPIKVLRHLHLLTLLISYCLLVFHSPLCTGITRRLALLFPMILFLHVHISHTMRAIDDL